MAVEALRMTKAQIKTILDRVRTWPEKRQAELARIALHLEAQDGELLAEDQATRSAIAEGLAQSRQRKYASDRRIREVWKKFGL
jgi:hypothetical protein